MLDGGDEQGLRALGQASFDSALCNMALFDMAEIEPLFRNLYSLLKPGGRFVYSMVHPCFNQADATRYSEFEDRDGELVLTYGVRVSGYMTPAMRRGLALRGQPTPQPYFHRPLDMLLNVGLGAGFVLTESKNGRSCYPSPWQARAWLGTELQRDPAGDCLPDAATVIHTHHTNHAAKSRS